MKYSEFKRWLEKQGAIFKPGKGSHLHVELNGKHFLAIPRREGNTGAVGERHQERLRSGIKENPDAVLSRNP
ncbi:MAG: hypothetical protein ACRERU_05690 [Methylococcales bacterium]